MCVAEWNTFSYLLNNQPVSWCHAFAFQWTDDETTTAVTVRLIPRSQSKLSRHTLVQVLKCVSFSGPRIPRVQDKGARGNKCSRWACLPKAELERPSGEKHLLRIAFHTHEYIILTTSFIFRSCSQDANWIALNSSLQCQSLCDIFLLFKSSDFITHDLTQP